MWQSASDPVVVIQRTTAAMWVAAGAIVAPTAWWAIANPTAPCAAPEGPEPASPPASPDAATSPAQIDPAAFNARLWNPAPVEPPVQVAAAPPPPPPPPPPPARPLPVLLAIMRDQAQGPPIAALYDPQENVLVLAREGDSILGRSVARISGTTVELHAGPHVSVLTLEPEGGAR